MRGTTAAVIPLRGMARGWDREGDRCGGTFARACATFLRRATKDTRSDTSKAVRYRISYFAQTSTKKRMRHTCQPVS